MELPFLLWSRNSQALRLVLSCLSNALAAASIVGEPALPCRAGLNRAAHRALHFWVTEPFSEGPAERYKVQVQGQPSAPEATLAPPPLAAMHGGGAASTRRSPGNPRFSVHTNPDLRVPRATAA